MSMCCKDFGLQEINMKDVRGLSNTEVKEMLKNLPQIASTPLVFAAIAK